jgi:hypothetical protein
MGDNANPASERRNPCRSSAEKRQRIDQLGCIRRLVVRHCHDKRSIVNHFKRVDSTMQQLLNAMRMHTYVRTYARTYVRTYTTYVLTHIRT